MSFLTEKYGPLPAWGWGAAAGGLLLVAKATGSRSGGGRSSGSDSAGRDPEGMDAAQTSPQSLGGDSGPVTGMSTSVIDGSFFGNGILDYHGPSSIPWDGISDYVDVFPHGMRGKRGKHHHHEGHIYHGPENVPVGAGGVGRHHPHWHGEAPPAGGEGYHNHGQSTGSHRYAGMGGPHPQQTTMVGPLQTYTSQRGDNMHHIANKMYGPGQNGVTIHQANPGIVGSPTDEIPPGHVLTIPSPPMMGPAPGGVAGNGVGSGAWMGSTRARTMSASLHGNPTGQQDDDLGKDKTARPLPGKAGHGRRGGRGIKVGS